MRIGSDGMMVVRDGIGFGAKACVVNWLVEEIGSGAWKVMVIVGWYTWIVKNDGVKEINEKWINVVTESETIAVLVDGERELICAVEVMDEHTLTVLEADNEMITEVSASDLLVVTEVSFPIMPSSRKPDFFLFFFFFSSSEAYEFLFCLPT